MICLADASAPGAAPASQTDEEFQKIYDHLPRTEDVFNLNANNLQLRNKLGQGNFGDVMKGVFMRKGKEIPVAVKTLKHDDIAAGQVSSVFKEMPEFVLLLFLCFQSEIMREAKLMADLQHRNIVRLIGVCRSDTLMLVMELATLGPLNKYLKNHP